MTGKLLLRGMIAGVVGGLLAFLFARIYGEPLVDFAIAFEEQAGAAAGGAAEPELVSRATQAGFGLLTGVIVYSTALGGILSLVFAVAYGRFSHLAARPLAALLALAGFVAVILVPAIKYPANPPAVGSEETIVIRTELYFLMLAVSVAAMVIAFALARRCWRRLGAWNASLAGGAAFIVIMAAVTALLPAINEVPESFSAVVLWQFRVASLGIHAIIWTTHGLLFGFLADRLLAGSSGIVPRPVRA